MENLDYLDFCVEQEAEPLLRLSQEKGVGGFWPFRLIPLGKNTEFGNQGPAGAWNAHPAALSLGIGLLVPTKVGKGKLKIQGKAWRGTG